MGKKLRSTEDGALLLLPLRGHMNLAHSSTERAPEGNAPAACTKGEKGLNLQQLACDTGPSFLTTQKHFLSCLPNLSTEGLPVNLAVLAA